MHDYLYNALAFVTYDGAREPTVKNAARRATRIEDLYELLAVFRGEWREICRWTANCARTSCTWTSYRLVTIEDNFETFNLCQMSS